jgi:hypothetical protein
MGMKTSSSNGRKLFYDSFNPHAALRPEVVPVPDVSARLALKGWRKSEPLPTSRGPRRIRIILAFTALLVAFLGMTASGYISHVVGGIGRVPLMFATAHAASQPVPVAARSQPAHQR